MFPLLGLPLGHTRHIKTPFGELLLSREAFRPTRLFGPGNLRNTQLLHPAPEVTVDSSLRAAEEEGRASLSLIPGWFLETQDTFPTEKEGRLAAAT